MSDYKKIPLVFNVYKPSGPSSFNVVYHFKKNLGYDFGKIGHFGTLDPFAEGVLLIGVQGAQRLNEYIHKLLPKTYRAVGFFGEKTESGDSTKVVSERREVESKWQTMSLEEVEEFLKKEFLGEYWQAPHSVSASKFEGKRLYHLALKGQIIQKEKVKREIFDFKVIKYEYPIMEFSVEVSSGTYVRSLFEEIASLMGGVGHLKVLERLGIGNNFSKEAIQETSWPQKGEEFDLRKWGRPLDKVLSLNEIHLNQDQTIKYLQGQRYLMILVEIRKPLEEVVAEDIVWVYSYEGMFLGLARIAPTTENLPELQAIFNLPLAISHYL
jgi:tRNA pseudouridine55 synthase